MQLSETIKLYPTSYQKQLITSTMHEYIDTVNSLVSTAVSGNSISKYTTADFECELPSALANQCIRDAKSIVKKHYKLCHSTIIKNRKRELKRTAPKLPILHKPCCYINNQNFKIKDNGMVEFPVIADGKSTRLSVKTSITDRQYSLLSNTKLGTARIVFKNNKLCIQIIYEETDVLSHCNGNVMGIDLGIKCPAVSYCSDGSIKFYGNGRKNKYMRRHYAYLRRKAQKAKKPEVVERLGNKEQRIMRDIDHKLSHDIISTAVEHNVRVIKLEQLQNIRSTTRTSRKNNHSLHTWSFYRFAQFIEYKAKRVGITVEYVNPMYTSQRCPECGSIHHADDRNYSCECGYHIHRDILGAVNIMNSTEFVGNRQTA